LIDFQKWFLNKAVSIYSEKCKLEWFNFTEAETILRNQAMRCNVMIRAIVLLHYMSKYKALPHFAY